MKNNNEIVEFNKKAWNRQVQNKNQWTIPVDSECIARARKQDFQILLTPEKFVPRHWFPKDLHNLKILALASGGGQQAPILAACGAKVSVLDNSPMQLQRDAEVAERENLELELVEGDMMNIKAFANESFDLIFHPCSNSFVPDVNKVWQQAYKLLKPGGYLLSGLVNPVVFTPDFELEKQGIVQMKYSIPYADTTSLSAEERLKYLGPDEPLSFGHSLEDLIGGQTKLGFKILDFYEDGWSNSPSPIHKYLKCFFATLAQK